MTNDANTKPPVTIFYSWQSDLPNKLNRGFVHQALERAARDMGRDDSILVEPVIDRDTSNVAGAPDIGATIFSKIERAAAVVCDVSIVSGSGSSRPTPNPNVLIELGYALHALGWERVLLVMNEAFGGPPSLPFDLKMKRVIVYRAEDGASNTEERLALQKKLEAGLRLVLKDAKAETPAPTRVALAMAAIQQGAPDAASRVKDFMVELVSALDGLKPARGTQDPDEKLVESLQRSLEVTIQFAHLADVIGRSGSKDGALATIGGFERIAAGYDVQEAGTFRRTDFDFHKFMGHELFVILTSALMRHDRWDALAALMAEPICFERNGGLRSRRFTTLSTHVALFDARDERLNLRRVSVHADVLKERHGQGELGQLSPWPEFVEADYLLYLRTELEADESPTEDIGRDFWRPWSVIYVREAGPKFLVRAESRSFAERLLPVLGVPSIEALRSRYSARSKNIREMYRRRSPFFEVPTVDPERLGSR